MASEVQETEDEDDLSEIRAMAERLKVYVRYSGGNKRVSQVSGVPLRTLNSYLAAAVDPKMTKLGRIAKACGTTVDVLMGKTDPGDFEQLSSGRRMILQSGDGTSVFESEIVELDSAPVPPDGFVAVPYLDVRASAGGGRVVLSGDLVAASHFMFSKAWLRSLGVAAQDAELLQAQGDSMFPTIHDGDLMLVDRGYGDVVHGKIYALVVNDMVVVKRVNMLSVGGMMLISDNERYPAETVSRDEVNRLNFQGRVAWYGRAI